MKQIVTILALFLYMDIIDLVFLLVLLQLTQILAMFANLARIFVKLANLPQYAFHAWTIFILIQLILYAIIFVQLDFMKKEKANYVLVVIFLA